MSKFTVILFALTVLGFSSMMARPQTASPTSTMAPPSPASTPKSGQNLRGAPCRGPPAVGQYKIKKFQAPTKTNNSFTT